MSTAAVRPVAGPEPGPDPPAAPRRPCRGRGWVYANSRDDIQPDKVQCHRCRGTGTAAPFDRASHCAAIAAGGGLRTSQRHGSAHFRAIGKAGARATIARHDLDTYLGIVTAKGWGGPRRPDLAADLALGDDLAA